jgi:hypothetical protein
VVDAAEVLLVRTVIVEANERAPVRAAILESIDLAVGIAGDDDRRVADETGAEIPRLC